MERTHVEFNRLDGSFIVIGWMTIIPRIGELVGLSTSEGHVKGRVTDVYHPTTFLTGIGATSSNGVICTVDIPPT